MKRTFNLVVVLLAIFVSQGCMTSHMALETFENPINSNKIVVEAESQIPFYVYTVAPRTGEVALFSMDIDKATRKEMQELGKVQYLKPDQKKVFRVPSQLCPSVRGAKITLYARFDDGTEDRYNASCYYNPRDRQMDNWRVRGGSRSRSGSIFNF